MKPKNGTPQLLDGHVYDLSGKKYPSVTTIIQALNPVCYAHNPVLIERGNQFHSLCHAVADDSLDWTRLDKEQFGIATAYSNFLAAFMAGGEVPMIERPMVSVRGYAGTPDQVFFRNKLLVDLKFGQKQKKNHSLQLIAYFNLLLDNYPDDVSRRGWKLLAVYPQPDGNFDVLNVKYSDSQSAIWNAYVIVYRHTQS